MRVEIFDKINIKELVCVKQAVLYHVADVGDVNVSFRVNQDNIDFRVLSKNKSTPVGYYFWHHSSVKFHYSDWFAFAVNETENPLSIDILYEDRNVRFSSISFVDTNNYIFMIKKHRVKDAYLEKTDDD